ncbi:MAG: alpha/beta hydrolase [Clostridia bacterium]|nr:alpha/beta hydrolase [Clostridia bacterium]
MLWNAKNAAVASGSTSMNYVSFGHGKRVLILLPGLSDGLMTVKGKALLLAPSYRRFFESFTVYMFSRKDEMPPDYSIREMAEDQAQALRTLGIEKCSVLGISQGGMIAQYLAADHPDLVEKLVLAVTAAQTGEMTRDRVQKWIDYALSGDHKALMIDTAENSYSPARLKAYRKLYPVIGAVGKPKSYDRFLTNARAILSFDAASVLPSLSCPVLIIGGEEDRIVGAEASRELHRLIPGSRLVLCPGLGHAAYEEAKDFDQTILDFLLLS